MLKKNLDKSLKFKIADLHCHPNLKPFGHSFSMKNRRKSNIWFYNPPTTLSKLINVVSGITKFSQADFTTMSKGNVKIAFVSLYPFEKGFFLNNYFKNAITAWLANIVTSVGFQRIRFIQNHLDYFQDLVNEYNFLKNSSKNYKINNIDYSWDFASSCDELTESFYKNNKINVILTIEGAHILNSGLSVFGYKTRENEILNNIKKIKDWEHPPFFITFAHNFNNELCGHARSLNQLGPMVNQFENLNAGISDLGRKAINGFLNNRNQKRILIDLKHMSVKSRFEYYDILENEYNNKIPLIVSHGAVTGTNIKGKHLSSIDTSFLCSDDINFFDDELVLIAKSKGLFALQMDGNRLTNKSKSRKSIFSLNAKSDINKSAEIVWYQLQHIAEILDSHNLNGWNTACLGTDFDGTINPLSGIWTAEDLQLLANKLFEKARHYISNKNVLQKSSNRDISPLELVENFVFNNTNNFLKNNF